MNRKYVVKLTEDERLQLNKLISTGEASERLIRRANILLKSDFSDNGPKWKYKAVCEAFNVSSITVYNVRKNYTDGGLERAIHRKKPERVYERRLDLIGEANLLDLACSEPPGGFQRWSLRLLKDRLIRMGIVDNISHETIRQTLRRYQLTPWLKDDGCNASGPISTLTYTTEDIVNMVSQLEYPKRRLISADDGKDKHAQLGNHR